MTRASRGGRPWGPIRAQSEEAAALARFLRAQVDASGKTLTVLAEAINYSKSQIGVFLAGKVPDEAFVTAMVRATSAREPLLRERRLSEATALLRAAQHPSPTATAVPPSDSLAGELAASRAQQIETYERLTRALEQQSQLHEAAGNSTKLVMVLLSMIDKLSRRIVDLTGEADQLRAAHTDPAFLAMTQRQLIRAQEQEQRAQQELIRAREKQRQAENLAAQVQAHLDQLADELDRLQADTTTSATTDSDPVPAPHETTVSTDPVGDDIDQVLTRVVEVNDHDNDLLQVIANDLGPGDGATVVVQDKRPDNPRTSSDTADNVAQAASTRAVKALSDAMSRADAQGDTGDAAGAAAVYTELLPHMLGVLGSDHPDTLTARSKLAAWQRQAGDTTAGAIAVYTNLLPDMARILGPDHPHTLATRDALADLKGETGDDAAKAAQETDLALQAARTELIERVKALALARLTEQRRVNAAVPTPSGTPRAPVRVRPATWPVSVPASPYGPSRLIELAARLQALRARAGVAAWPPQRMSTAAFPGKATSGAGNSAHLATVVARWLRGETFPISTEPLVNLIRALGASADETDELIALHEEVRRQDGRYGKGFGGQQAAHDAVRPSPPTVVPPSSSVRYGTVKWFNSEKGFGFLMQDNGGPDAFIHYTRINTPGYQYLEEGERVQYEVKQGLKGPEAMQIEPLDRTTVAARKAASPQKSPRRPR